METSGPSNFASPPAAAPLVSPGGRRRFFDLLPVLLCYSGGVILGTGLAALLWWGGPEPWDDPWDFSGIIGLTRAGALNLAVSACILGIVGLLMSNRWRGGGPLFCMLLGTAAPLIGLLMGDLADLWLFTNYSPPAAWAQSAWFRPIIYAIPGIGAAFVLLRPEPLTRWKQRIASAALAVTCVVVLYTHSGLANSIYEQALINYQPTLDKIAAWVKATYPQRSVNSEIQLPAQFPRLPESQSEQIQAILVPSGPVLILITLYQETSLSDGGPALIYVTTPLAPKQFGKDSNGNPSIHVHGIWGHHVVKQLSPQLYLVELNKDPDQ
jgi:hypothetical protein